MAKSPPPAFSNRGSWGNLLSTSTQEASQHLLFAISNPIWGGEEVASILNNPPRKPSQNSFLPNEVHSTGKTTRSWLGEAGQVPARRRGWNGHFLHHMSKISFNNVLQSLFQIKMGHRHLAASNNRFLGNQSSSSQYLLS